MVEESLLTWSAGKKVNNVKKHIFFLMVVLITAVVVFIYGGIFKTFYQQDEWMALGHILTQGYGAFISSYSFLDLLTGQGRVLAVPVHFSFFYFFPFSISPFALFSISLHIVNSVLAYFVAKKISRNNLIAFIVGLFFAVASSADQAITWVAGASTTTLPSATFVFLAIILYLQFIEKNNKKYLWLSLLLAVVSSYFKESGLFVFILLPLTFLIFSKRFNKEFLLKTLKLNWLFIVFIILISLVKINSLSSPSLTGRFSPENGGGKEKIIYHAFLYPITSFSQMYINQAQMFSFSSQFQKVFYSYLSKSDPNPLIAEFVVADMLSILSAFAITIIITAMFFVRKDYRKIIIFGLLFTFLSFLPYVVLDKPNAYLESRYYYISLFGAGLLLGAFIDFLTQIFKKKLIRYKYLGVVVVFSLLLSYFWSQIIIVRIGINNQISSAQERINFLNSVKRKYPNLPSKVIFYMSGSQDFNSEGNKIPFQQGPGYTLMVWYYKTGTIPSKLLTEDFLWDMMSQGYKEEGDRGFGYFRSYEDLSRKVEEISFPVKNVLSFYYDAKDKKLIDISGEIQASLSARTIIK